MDWLPRELITQNIELHRQIRYLEQLIDKLDAAVAVVNTDLVYQMANQTFASMIDRQARDLLGKTMFSIFPGTNDSQVTAIFANVLLTGEPFTARRFPFTYPDRGHVKAEYWDGTASAISNDQGEHVGIMIICANVTDQVRLEEEQNSRIAAMESSVEAMFSAATTGVITGWNNSARRVYGYAAEEIVDRPVDIVVPRDKLEELRTDIAELKKGNRVTHVTARIRKSGERFPAFVNKLPVRSAAGEVVGIFASTRDLSERRVNLA